MQHPESVATRAVVELPHRSGLGVAAQEEADRQTDREAKDRGGDPPQAFFSSGSRDLLQVGAARCFGLEGEIR